MSDYNCGSPEAAHQITKMPNEIDRVAVFANLFATVEYKPTTKAFSVFVYNLAEGNDQNHIIYPS
jgi:hypothetical protein